MSTKHVTRLRKAMLRAKNVDQLMHYSAPDEEAVCGAKPTSRYHTVPSARLITCPVCRAFAILQGVKP